MGLTKSFSILYFYEGYKDDDNVYFLFVKTTYAGISKVSYVDGMWYALSAGAGPIRCNVLR